MITFFTLALDAMPWIQHHYNRFTQLPMPWKWVVVEGVAGNNADTSWCAKIEPRLSQDGTTEYLDSLKFDARVTVMRQPYWHSKTQMCNTALAYLAQPCLLWQVDADELWTPGQIKAVYDLFQKHPDRNCAYFWCLYFVGPDIVVDGHDSWANNPAYEWKRVWRFKPRMKFATHEPPRMAGMVEKPFTHAETEAIGAVFEHHGYATLQQVEFKQRYYAGDANPNATKYANLVDGWKQLQANTEWPVKLNKFMPFVGEDTMATRL